MNRYFSQKKRGAAKLPSQVLTYVRITGIQSNPGRYKALFVLFLAVPEDLPRSLIFPVAALLDGPVTGDGFVGAIGNAAAAVPALVRVQDDRGLAFFRIGDKYVYLANINTVVAASAESRIELYRIGRGNDIGVSKNFFMRHGVPPYFLS
jgi:hypothetical protein